MRWAAAAIFMLGGQDGVARERAILDEQQAAIASSAMKVSTYLASVTETAKELEKRQEFLEDLVKSHFVDTLEDDKLIGPSKNKTPSSSGSKISAVIPGAHALHQIEARQLAFARQLSGAVAARTKTVEAAIRGFGLKPNAMLRRTRSAQGGPFIPYKSPDGIDPQFAQLNNALDRLDRLENTLLAFPSGRPTTVLMLSIGFGYRPDPFNVGGAFHAGLVFRVAYGQPILAAANGKVSFVGRSEEHTS